MVKFTPLEETPFTVIVTGPFDVPGRNKSRNTGIGCVANARICPGVDTIEQEMELTTRGDASKEA